MDSIEFDMLPEHDLSWSGTPVDHSSDLLKEARSLGFQVEDNPDLIVDPEAARLLPPDFPALGIARTQDVLAVLVDHLPTPAEMTTIEKACGMILMVSVADPDVYKTIKDRSDAQVLDGAPRQVGPALMAAVAQGASDVHLSVGSPPILRVAGSLVPLSNWPALSAIDLEHTARWVAGDDMEAFKGDHDCAITYADSRWRVSLYRQRQSLALALRRIPTDVPKLEDLSLPASVVQLAGLSQGLVLFCGPTGSGKSTSLAALLDRINRTRTCHILTIEDPVEYVHKNKTATVHQREVGEDTESFATGLRHALRQDPDVILVGEMRDLETMQMALAAAETGHLVLATVHASSTSGVFNRIIDAFPAGQQAQIRTQLASSLRAVVAQVLVPAIPKGSRQVVCEVLVVNDAVKNMVREDRLHEVATVLESSGASGMTSMDKSLAAMTASGRIDPMVARQWSHDQSTFEEHLARLPQGARLTTSLRGLDDLDDLSPMGHR